MGLELKVSVENDRQCRGEFERLDGQQRDNGAACRLPSLRCQVSGPGRRGDVELGELKVTRYEVTRLLRLSP